jgi:phosphoenolpyruvate carboxykinase (ATP)
MAPHEYAEAFLLKIKKHEINCWLMNTGWVGECHGDCERTSIATSRKLVEAALSGELGKVEFETDPVFGFELPTSCPGVPSDILNPRNLAKDDGDYEVRANRLIVDFVENFKIFGDKMPKSVLEMVASIPVLENSLDLMEQFDLSI